MSDSTTGALLVARRLVRTFSSAPDPRRRAREVHSELMRWNWRPGQCKRIESFGRWVASNPPEGELRARCAVIIAEIDDLQQPSIARRA